MTTILSPGLYTMDLRSIGEPKVKSKNSFLLVHQFGVPDQLFTAPTWLYFSSLDTLQAYLLAAPSLLGKLFTVEVEIKEQKVGNRGYSWNILKPKWELGTLAPAAPRFEYEVNTAGNLAVKS